MMLSAYKFVKIGDTFSCGCTRNCIYVCTVKLTFLKTEDVLVTSVQYVTGYTICILVLLSLFQSLVIRHPDVCATLVLSFYFLCNLTATLHQTYDIYIQNLV